MNETGGLSGWLHLVQLVPFGAQGDDAGLRVGWYLDADRSGFFLRIAELERTR